MMGAAAAATESDTVWSLVLSNPALSDAVPVFDATRGNIAYSTALTAASLEAARAYFRTAQTENGASMALVPKYLVVGPDLEVTAERLLRPPAVYSTGVIADALTESLRASLELVVEPRITAGEWLLFSDTSRADTFEYAWLQGARGPVVEREVSFTTKNLNLSVVDDFGAGAIDARGCYLGTDAVAP